MTRLRSLNPFLVLVIVVALVAALALVFWPKGERRTITAEFPRAVSLYEGSAVKVLGVTVGEVESVRPAGDKVKVRFSYDAEHKVPANAKAAVIAPSIVGDRFIQLTPAYRSGPTLADDTHLGPDRTATPLELDEIFSSLNELSVALGPEGANKPDETGTGALTRLLDSTARNFGGQGVQFNKTLKNIGKLTQTLSNNKDDLFGTIAEIQKFTGTLAENDDTVRAFNDSLAEGAELLEGEREDLAQVIKQLGTAMKELRGFVAENRDLLGSNIRDLNKLSKILVKRRGELDAMLKDAPVALNNLLLAGNTTAGSLDTRMALGENIHQATSEPGQLLCNVIGDLCGPLTPLLDKLKVPDLGRAAALTSGQPDRVVEPVDRSLAGLVEVQR